MVRFGLIGERVGVVMAMKADDAVDLGAATRF